MNYFGRENQVFYVLHDREGLFLTIHPTSSNLTMEEQAKVLAEMLNGLKSVKK